MQVLRMYYAPFGALRLHSRSIDKSECDRKAEPIEIEANDFELIKDNKAA